MIRQVSLNQKHAIIESRNFHVTFNNGVDRAFNEDKYIAFLSLFL